MSTTTTIQKIEPGRLRPGVRPIDIRPTAAYNGWALEGESRGGHIPGAISFPYAWAEKSFDGELVDCLAEKGVTPAVPIVIYGYDDDESLALAQRLLTLGYDDIAVIEGGQDAWAQNDLELVRLPRFQQLVPPQWLARLLNGDEVDEGPDGRVAVFHVNYGVPKDYARGHIPGAFHLDTNVLESSEDWNRRSPEELERALVELGITKETTVVVYGNDTARDPRETKPGRRAGQIAATRAAAILLYAGVDDVRLLDGGLNAWRLAGLPIETVERIPQPVSEFGVTIPANPNVFIDYDEAVELLSDPNGALVSIRSRPENIGQTSGYNYIRETGDIKGAVWGNNGTDAYHMENYRNVDNTMRDFNEVAASWKGAGITPDKKVSFYCGTGWRASETFFYAHVMGWPEVSVYDGGWFEWTRKNGAISYRE